MSEPVPLCILGLGLIGGSLLRRVALDRRAWGWSPSAATREHARADGFDVAESLGAALAAATEQDALVVLAAPWPAFDELLTAVAAEAPRTRLTDVASVKVPVAELVSQRVPSARFIGGHPMAGTSRSGWAAGSPELFTGAAWVTTLDEDSDPDVWADVAELALAAGSRVVPVEAGPHDAAVARISHLPHLLALALAQVAAEGGPLALALAAGSFADGTRVAGTRPELVRAMCETNADALVPAIDDALALLGVARASLASTGSLAKLTAAGHAARLQYDRRADGLTPITLTGPDLPEQLLSVGALGGYISAVHRSAVDSSAVDRSAVDRGTGLSASGWVPALDSE